MFRADFCYVSRPVLTHVGFGSRAYITVCDILKYVVKMETVDKSKLDKNKRGLVLHFLLKSFTLHAYVDCKPVMDLYKYMVLGD